MIRLIYFHCFIWEYLTDENKACSPPYSIKNIDKTRIKLNSSNWIFSILVCSNTCLTMGKNKYNNNNIHRTALHFTLFSSKTKHQCFVSTIFKLFIFFRYFPYCSIDFMYFVRFLISIFIFHLLIGGKFFFFILLKMYVWMWCISVYARAWVCGYKISSLIWFVNLLFVKLWWVGL